MSADPDEPPARRPPVRDKKRLDPTSLKALAHRLRADLFHALLEGPATSAQLARRFGGNTGTVSWHLRELARFGFIEDDPDRGSGRERWWRAAVGGTVLDVRDEGMQDDPVTLEAARWLARDSADAAWDALQRFVATIERWSPEWIGASLLRSQTLRLTPAQLSALQAELQAVLDRYRDGDDTDERGAVGRDAADDVPARRVQVTLHLFPKGEPDAAAGHDAAGRAATGGPDGARRRPGRPPSASSSDAP